MTDIRRRGLSDQWDYVYNENDSGEESESTVTLAEEEPLPEIRAEDCSEEQDSDAEDDEVDYPDEGDDWEDDGEEPVWEWEMVVSFDDIDPNDLEEAMIQYPGRFKIDWQEDGAYIRCTYEFAVILTHADPKEKRWSTRIDDRY